MEWLAFAIVISTVLFLVDKNSAWHGFRRAVIWGLAALVVMVGAYAAWENHAAQKAFAQPPVVKWDK